MANLKGKTFEKQIKNAFFRILENQKDIDKVFKRAKKKGYDTDLIFEYFTRSKYMKKTRKHLLTLFKNFIENELNIKEGKINLFMTEEVLDKFFDFLCKKQQDKKIKTCEGYVTGFNSMLKALQLANVTIPLDPLNNDFLSRKFKEIREYRKNNFFLEENKSSDDFKYIGNALQLYKELTKDNIDSKVNGLFSKMFLLQYQTSFTTEWIYAVLKNLNKHLQNKDNKWIIKGMFDKNFFTEYRIYEKEIDEFLALELLKMNKSKKLKKILKNTSKERLKRNYGNFLKKHGVNVKSVIVTFYLNVYFQNQFNLVQSFGNYFSTKTLLSYVTEITDRNKNSLTKYFSNKNLFKNMSVINPNIFFTDNYPVIELDKEEKYPYLFLRYVYEILGLKKKKRTYKYIVEFLKEKHHAKFEAEELKSLMRKIKIKEREVS